MKTASAMLATYKINIKLAFAITGGTLQASLH